jgi:hypothetical protein
MHLQSSLVRTFRTIKIISSNDDSFLTLLAISGPWTLKSNLYPTLPPAIVVLHAAKSQKLFSSHLFSSLVSPSLLFSCVISSHLFFPSVLPVRVHHSLPNHPSRSSTTSGKMRNTSFLHRFSSVSLLAAITIFLSFYSHCSLTVLLPIFHQSFRREQSRA